MVYRRKGRKGYTFQARTQTGWEQLGTGTANKALAQRIETMWETLASTHRAWDILQPILDCGRSRSKLLGTLYDLWLDTKYDISEVRRRLNDANVEPYVDEYMNIFRQQGGLETTAAYNTAYLRYLLPEGAPVLVSECSEEWLTEQLYAYRDAKGKAVKGATLRKVHSAWSGFFDYLVRPKRLLTSNPLAHVPRPEVAKLPIRFYELKEVEKIIFAQPTLERRALFSLAYGTGLEPIVIVGRKTQPIVTALTRSDFDEQSHEVRAAGTKTHTRDRMALVADWAWPTVQAYLKTMLPNVPLFQRDRSTITHWHLDTVRSLKLPEYPLYCARHHWAVRQLRAGAPIGVVQRQLGHATAKETLDTYGQFIPDGVDRKKWEREATKYDKRRAAQ